MNINRIIAKLMGDGSIGEEQSTLEAWKKEAEDNIKALEDIRKIAALSNTLNGYEDFNPDNAWNNFESNLDASNQTETVESKPKATLFSIRNLSRIAAVLIVVIGGMFVFNTFSGNAAEEITNTEYVASAEVLDFTLEDGTSVMLDKNSNVKIVDNRKISMVGRAHFDVAKDPNNAFTIDLPVGEIVVLGTQFTVVADEEVTEVFVTEGSVRYQLASRTFTLVAGDLVRVENNDVDFPIGRVKDLSK